MIANQEWYVKYVYGYAGNGCNEYRQEHFATKLEADKRAYDLKKRFFGVVVFSAKSRTPA